MSAGSGGPLVIKIETPNNFDLHNAIIIEKARVSVLDATIHFLQHQVDQQNKLIQRLRHRSPN